MLDTNNINLQNENLNNINLIYENLLKDSGISNIKQNNIYTNSQILCYSKLIKNFDYQKLIVNELSNKNFEIKYSISFDNIEWTNPDSLTNIFESNFLNISNNILPDIYLNIWLRKIPQDYFLSNMRYDDFRDNDTIIDFIVFDKILYNSSELALNDFTIRKITDTIIENPNFNIYDNQQITQKRYIETNIAITRMRGITCIYFKADTIEKIDSLATNVSKQITQIKKLKITLQNSDAPQDNLIFNEWDMGMPNEFTVQLLDSQFKQAFGTEEVPMSKDFIYIPLFKKLYRIQTPQPIRKHLGILIWWDLYLNKYEDDEMISMSSDIFDIYSNNLPGFDNENILLEDELKDTLNDFIEITDNTVLDSKNIEENTSIEKNLVTQNFSNKLTDSTSFVDLKTTEAYREFYNKRLPIVSINSDNETYPITMYNPIGILPKTFALTYNLKDINYLSYVKEWYQFNFNFVLTQKFSGNIFDICFGTTNNTNVPILSLSNNRKKLSLQYYIEQQTFTLSNFNLELNELYQFSLTNNIVNNLIHLKIVQHNGNDNKIVFNNQFELDFNTDIYNNNKISQIFLYGGSYLIGQLKLIIDKKQIMEDNCNPILVMNKFGVL